MEPVIAELSDVPGLEVVSRNGVKPCRDSSLPIDSIARILRAGTLIGDSIEESPDSVRVLLHLIDGASGTQLQSITITRPIRDLFNLEDDFASQVSRRLKGRLGRDLDLRRKLGGTESPEARELVLGAEKARGEAADLTSNPDPLEAATGLRYLVHADSLLMRAERYHPAWPEPITLWGWVALDRAARFGTCDRLRSGKHAPAKNLVALLPELARETVHPPHLQDVGHGAVSRLRKEPAAPAPLPASLPPSAGRIRPSCSRPNAP